MVHSDYTVGCDAHKHFSLFAVLDEKGDLVGRTRVGHAPGAIGAFLAQFPEGTPVALETVGNWYSRKDTGTVWIVDEIEATGCIPLLAHAAKAKIMMGNVHKTNKLDAQGLATLLYLGKLPSGVDSTGQGAGRAGAAPHPDDLCRSPHQSEEPHFLHPGQTRALPGWSQRYLRREMAA